MQITIKEVTNNGNDLKGVTINVSVKEIAQMDEAGLHLFGPNTPVDDLPDFAVFEEDTVKKEDLFKQEKKITCRTFIHRNYNEGKVALVKRWLAENRVEYNKNSGITTDFFEYDLDIDQVKKLYLYLSSCEDGTKTIII